MYEIIYVAIGSTISALGLVYVYFLLTSQKTAFAIARQSTAAANPTRLWHLMGTAVYAAAFALFYSILEWKLAALLTALEWALVVAFYAFAMPAVRRTAAQQQPYSEITEVTQRILGTLGGPIGKHLVRASQ